MLRALLFQDRIYPGRHTIGINCSRKQKRLFWKSPNFQIDASGYRRLKQRSLASYRPYCRTSMYFCSRQAPNIRQPGYRAWLYWYAYYPASTRSEEHTSELQSIMRISYADVCLKETKPRIT